MKKIVFGLILCILLVGIVGFAAAISPNNSNPNQVIHGLRENGTDIYQNAQGGPSSSHCRQITTESVCNNYGAQQTNTTEPVYNYGASICSWDKQTNSCAENNNALIGGQRDSHGCLGPAGYSWNNTEQRCVREWSHGEDRYQENDKNLGMMGLGTQIRNRVHAGMYVGPNGEQIRVSEMAQNRMRLHIGNRSVDCDEDCNMTQETIQNKTRLRMYLRDGNESEIKIMPDRASDRAMERLRLKVCNESNNCTMQLKEVGKGNKTRAAYELQVERHAKLLGFFKMKAQEKAQVDAETGDVIAVKKPWWSFLATNSD